MEHNRNEHCHARPPHSVRLVPPARGRTPVAPQGRGGGVRRGGRGRAAPGARLALGGGRGGGARARPAAARGAGALPRSAHRHATARRRCGLSARAGALGGPVRAAGGLRRGGGADARHHRLCASLRRRGRAGPRHRRGGGRYRPLGALRARRHARRRLGAGAIRGAGRGAGPVGRRHRAGGPRHPRPRRQTRRVAAAGGAGRGRPVTIAPPGQLHAALAPLPVAALRLPDGMAADLGRLGLRRIGDLADSRARRWGGASARR